MSVRLCACGCRQPIPERSNARYATSACRTRHWKEREGYTDHRQRKASRNAKSKPPGLQVSAGKITSRIEELLVHYGVSPRVAALKARVTVHGTLPAAQRTRYAELQAKSKEPPILGERQAA